MLANPSGLLELELSGWLLVIATGDVDTDAASTIDLEMRCGGSDDYCKAPPSIDGDLRRVHITF